MKPIVILMGVCGSGKSTVGKLLAEKTGGVFIEGDDFHSKENVAKMKSGEALIDDDRAEWLVALSQEIQLADERPYFLSCSALKGSYRELLRLANPERVEFVFLHGAEELLRERLEARTDHYMPAGLLESQLEILEVPKEALELDIQDSPEQLVEKIQELYQLSQ